MESTSAPLADYFWIAGIDSISYGEVSQGQGFSGGKEKATNGENKPPAVDTTIEEGSEVDSTSPTLNGSPPKNVAQHSRNSSWNRLNRSAEGRNSMQALEDLDLNSGSARSSVTIKAGSSFNGISNGTLPTSGLSDFDFDRALSKFASERETFLDDLTIQSGIITQQSRPPMTARGENRAGRLRHDDNGETLNSKKNPLRTVGGSIRRKISFRDMNSVRRQPSTVARSSESKPVPLEYIKLTKPLAQLLCELRDV